MNNYDKDIENLKIKMEDFNIFDIIKGKSEGGSKNRFKIDSGGNSDQIVALVQNIERKTFKKFDMVDEKIKVFQDEIYKKKNEITNLTTMIDTLSKSLNNHKDSFSNELVENIQSIKEIINFKENELKNNFQDQFNNLNEAFENKLKDFNGNFNTLPNEKKDEEIEKEIEKSKPGLSETEMKLLKDLTKKVHELDRAFRIFNK